MSSTIRVILPAKNVPQGATVKRIGNCGETSGDCEYTIQDKTVFNGSTVALPDSELCLVAKSPGKPSQLVSPETDVIALLSLSQVQSLMA